ncbi:hypothetical protein ACRALDRAFT_1063400 [Sodiomyces alcalophilus JCM 7366]|uniref:uncharacterized protein n=1 Tax=Sodiomyces alcalophilus JCM 7366 TaxID=591952 RepID=UPI0039B39066
MDHPVEDLRPNSSTRTPSHRASIGATSNATTFESHHLSRQRLPRSLPPWIDSFESDDGSISEEQRRLLQPPSRTRPPQHNHLPSRTDRRMSRDGFVDWGRDPALRHANSPPRRITLQNILRGRRGQAGRKWDHLRSAEPVIVPVNLSQNQDPGLAWRSYLQSSVYGRMEGEESEVVDPEVLDELQPGFDRPFDKSLYPHNQAHGRDANGRRKRRRQTLWERAWRVILRHPLVPLMFRLIVLVTAVSSLAVAARIYMHEDAQDHHSAETTQSIVAIVVDTVAVPYIGYMLWDEYTGKPLGLRAATQKIALILLDLFFIIFKSASTALAFESLVYHMDQRVEDITALSRALTSLMVVGLVAWTMTFMVNIFRTVARLGPGEG